MPMTTRTANPVSPTNATRVLPMLVAWMVMTTAAIPATMLPSSAKPDSIGGRCQRLVGDLKMK